MVNGPAMTINKRIPLFFFIFGLVWGVLANEPPRVFSTWEGFEPDKCASIWLIKRFIHKDAVFKFFPRGEAIKEGIAFDTPDAKLRRYHNMSTFESILFYYKLRDPKLAAIGKIIHDIEINVWARKMMAGSEDVLRAIREIIRTSKDNKTVIEKSCLYFDSLYETAGKE